MMLVAHWCGHNDITSLFNVLMLTTVSGRSTQIQQRAAFYVRYNKDR